MSVGKRNLQYDVIEPARQFGYADLISYCDQNPMFFIPMLPIVWLLVVYAARRGHMGCTGTFAVHISYKFILK